MPIVFFYWGACAFYALYILFNSIHACAFYISIQFTRAHFMRLYILFNSFHFYSFLFYSIQRDEKNETLRMITKKTNDNEKNENYEINE